ncbi:Kar5p Ecym_3417 [Eremothecium cymbalariae DBVPG|uniref:Nuclear fusion protein KAR5 n=1 Tax=Eremothecium cymbalariae (strain CBS 270.75 / DBVPG 7215 / KCTC 17166 / NRRL Y-17582) TaxID=931890 RepID=G8JRY4_ERECY|nr:Hypothetical protein Ecym_3417 [Eremothecium cymbalariae DBVPG\
MRKLLYILGIAALGRTQLSNLVARLSQNSPDDTNFHSVSQDIIANRFPILESSCVQRALSEFLPQCLQYGIETVSTETRIQAAVKLSVCELQASRVDNIPIECTSLSGTSECVRALEKSPQWWTTYSGNYQRLPSICFENALPYEKEQILSLFLNITDVYSGFWDDIVLEIEKYKDKFQETTEENLNSMKQKVEETTHEIIQHLKEELESMDSKLEDLNETVFEHSDSIRTVLGDIDEEINEYDVKGQILHLKHDTLSAWRDLNNEIDGYKNLQVSYLRDIDLIFEKFYAETSKSIGQVGNAIVDSQLDTINLISDFNNLLNNSILPALVDDLLPEVEHISGFIVNKLSAIDSMVDEKLDTWGSRMDMKLGDIESHISDTVEKVEEMNDSIEILQSRIGFLVSIGNNILRFLMCSYNFCHNLFVSYRALSFGVITLLYLFNKPIPFSISYLLLIKSVLVFIAAVLGARTGSLLSFK